MEQISQRINELSPAKRALLECRLRNKSAASQGIVRRKGAGGPIPASLAQQEMWLAQRLDPHGSAYNRPSHIRLRGALNIECLERALSEIVRRHEALRTAFIGSDGVAMQVVGEAAPIQLQLTDLSGLAQDQRMERLQALAGASVSQPFDLARADFQGGAGADGGGGARAAAERASHRIRWVVDAGAAGGACTDL